MRALSLSRPWTTAIELHGKRTENRTRWTDHPHLMAQAQRMVGEDLALHSSGTYDKQGALYVQRHTGVLYGRKDTADKAITSVARVECLLRAGDPCPPGQEAWYFGDTALLLANVRVLPEPVWVAGGLGFWTVQAAELEKVEAGLAALANQCECGAQADPRQRCVSCREPVCIRCAAYDDDGELFCPSCADARESGPDEGRWA
ncbi:ASCH domain-containing protein [Deinococcus multiflagellatus]|uniref:hypothetical protein n=1 Tax=Deinococcus multiflagellatus TaxID=1656887 RepID=UPI001CCE61AB|nr:hypothetical protein [Deinococcus multiflagellatus]MBZ9713780.1 hypothetical protein [Deinococcus multiflagellatus]